MATKCKQRLMVTRRKRRSNCNKARHSLLTSTGILIFMGLYPLKRKMR